MIEGCCLDHLDERRHLGVAEVLHQPEVEERDAPVAMEQIVARVRVAVERVHPVQAAKDEPEEHFAHSIAVLLRPLQHLLPRLAVNQLAGDHMRTAEGGQYIGNVDERVPAIEVGEELLIASLQPIVQFLDHSLLHLRHHLVGVQPAEALLQQHAQ